MATPLTYRLLNMSFEEAEEELTQCEQIRQVLRERLSVYRNFRKFLLLGKTIEDIDKTIQILERIETKHIHGKSNRGKKKERKGESPYLRLSTHSIEEILPLIKEEEETISLGEFNPKVKSSRFKTFAKSTKCVKCGIEGSFFALERHRFGKRKHSTPHLNFYGITEDGKEVLMTSDHIIPRALGGGDAMSNRQCMCQPCNSEKGATLPEKPC